MYSKNLYDYDVSKLKKKNFSKDKIIVVVKCKKKKHFVFAFLFLHVGKVNFRKRPPPLLSKFIALRLVLCMVQSFSVSLQEWGSEGKS